jgi:signal transduction histidine kinase/CHASE3 domain sensor protein
MFIFVGSLTYRNTNELVDANRWLTHTQRVLTELETVQSALESAESNQRGYIITGADDFLAPYHAAAAAADQHLRDLKALTADNRHQQHRLAVLERLVWAHLQTLQERAAVRRSLGLEAAAQAVRTGRGPRVDANIRLLIARLHDEAIRLLHRRQQDLLARTLQTRIVRTLGAVLALSILFLAFRFLNREISERRKMEDALRAARNNLEARVLERTAALVEINDSLRAEIAERERANHAREQEAYISAALARVGHELIAALDTGALLDRLCQVAAEVLQCETSHTLFWKPPEDVLRPIAGYGAPAEAREIARVVEVPRALLSTVLARLRHDDVAHIDPVPSAMRADPQPQSVQLGMALRRGAELIGIQVATRPGSHQPFSPTEERIAAGIAQIASLALEHARVAEELARVNRVKSDFVATMSHELRTPLNIIIGYNDLLQEGEFGPLTAEQRDTLRRMDKSAVSLLELINATLDLSRLDAGQVPLALAGVEVRDLVGEVEVETREQRQKPGVAFGWTIAAQLPPLYTDPLKLKIVLKNLISNAVKFTEQGSVVVDVRPSGTGVEFVVTDTGVGVPAEVLPIIFEPFRQGERPLTRRFGGVGLGLYIVRRLLDLLGGTITVESRVGQGSTFRAWLPGNATPSQAAA